MSSMVSVFDAYTRLSLAGESLLEIFEETGQKLTK
jgi:hypothetical protein